MHYDNSVVSDHQELRKEKDHIKKALNMNGYPNWIFNNFDQKRALSWSNWADAHENSLCGG